MQIPAIGRLLLLSVLVLVLGGRLASAQSDWTAPKTLPGVKPVQKAISRQPVLYFDSNIRDARKENHYGVSSIADLFDRMDVVVLIDKSGSMDIADCEHDRSRWAWCQEQAAQFSSEADKCSSRGITIDVFSSDFTSYPNVHPERIAGIFRENSPVGGTRLDKALSFELDDYFRRYESEGRPLALAVITDGHPDLPKEVVDVIARATQRMVNRDQIAITFLQVGNDAGGIEFARRVDDLVIAQGGRYHVVKTVDFNELQGLGLSRALLRAMNQ